LISKPERKKPFVRIRRRWKGNIRMDLREVGWEGVEWMHRAQDRDQLRALVNAIMNLQRPDSIKCGEFLN
jgi:hypothetical protein